ncbi:MAG: hypothetical protein LQ338_007096 [Usnochroma carphineum]|nr:MAG: hypothetical protein LQ338_007096 [Usnochroma carphineum]
MPPSTRRSAQKRQTDTRPRSDPDVPDSSPSRPAAKRKKVSIRRNFDSYDLCADDLQPNATVPRRQRRPKTPEIEPDDESDFDDSSSEAEAQTLADKIIPLLAVARSPVTVAVQHNNSQAEGTGSGVQAYAKICGRHWTYYVRELNVVVGRPPDPVSRHSSSIGAESSPMTMPRDDSDVVHIDLGPSKTISRCHAELFYAMTDQKWHIEVKGRNGLKVNDRDLRRGQQSILGCGDVIEIAGTQMMFVTAQERANIHPMFLEQMEMYEEGNEGTHGPAAGTHAHPEPSYPALPSSSLQRPPSTAMASSQSNGQPTIAPAPPDFVRPTTPVRSPRKSQQYSSPRKESPAYGRGFMIESTEQIDYSDEATKDLKPAIPYAVMITQAILSRPNENITLSGIYEWIKKNFAYYRHLKTNWQNSIRHNLSLHAAFSKVPRGANEPGKGMKWYIVPDKRAEMIAAVAKHMKKSNARHSSAPNSPSTLRDGSAQIPYAPPIHPQPYSSESNAESNGVIKTSPSVRSPPLTAYPTAQESYTPSRGPRMTALANHDHSHNLPSLSDDPSPLPIRRNNIRAGITDSSPVLTSGFYEGSMMTPAPRQHNLNIPLPTTAKLPTSHMPDSSPAPFWKYDTGSILGSTPARWPEISPLKAGNLQSSSPPPGATNGNTIESPTRGRGGRIGVGMGSQEADDEDGGIDLMRGFKPISKYHQELSTATAGNA